MTSDAERLKTLETIVDQGQPFPEAEFAKLTVGGQISLESRTRSELEELAGELGPAGLDAAIAHLAGLIEELAVGGAPAELLIEQRATIERLRLRRAACN